MALQTQVKIEEIDDKSPHLETVIALGDANKATLSFFPEGAFRARAAHRQILVAVDRDRCVGYLLYQYSRSHNRITIIHLCIEPSYRGRGLTKMLVDYLIKITKQYSGIGLTCRRDYGLDEMWSKLGFVVQNYKPAKTTGKELAYWWLDHGHPNLFSNAVNSQREKQLCVVIGTDIFFDLFADNNKESKLLLGDWLQFELDLCLTDAIFNKINTISNLDERRLLWNFAHNFHRFFADNQKLNTAHQKLARYFLQKNIAIDDSEVRHIARTIASGIKIFVTRDINLLDIGDEIYDKFQLSIIHPNNLIIQLEELTRNSEYEPIRLAGTTLELTRFQIGQESKLNDYFQSSETKAEFQQRLRRVLAETNKFECYIVNESENQPLALIVYGKHKPHELEIPILRIASSPLSATLARHLIFKAVLRSAREGRYFTRITDPYLQKNVEEAIRKDTFIRVYNGYLKVNLPFAETASKLSQRLSDIADTFGEGYEFCQKLSATLNTKQIVTDIEASASLEKSLFPVKIIDAEIPNFIIPIKPEWAIHLFDEQLASQDIWGAKPELAFNREAVYYRSATYSTQLKAPCRILWYVSQHIQKYYHGVGAIRACSFVDEVIIGKPKELYQRFQRLGVYKLTDVQDVLSNKDGCIMALRFSNTELFRNPIDFKQTQNILDKKVTLQSPFKISGNIFEQLYYLGIT